MLDLAIDVPLALLPHPAVRAVRPIGSRAEGRAHELSDWDFAVATDEFASVAHDLPCLVEPFEPIAEQWDPFSPHECYMLLLRGPTKVDLLFLGEEREPSPPWSPSAETLEAIDRHFWDWILYLEQKRRGGHDLVAAGLASMHEMLLAPMGVGDAPTSVAQAMIVYLRARDVLERALGVSVARELEREVRPVFEDWTR